MSSVLVVTDLDGTLLDHHSYDVAPAREALARLRRAGVPVIPNTSKTRAETQIWLDRLGLAHGAVVENGSAIVDGDRVEALGCPRAVLLAQLAAWRRNHGWRYEGFADLDVTALVARTGLNEAEARAALAREWSEPLRWQDSDAAWQAFSAAVCAQRWTLLRGGRFWHLVGDCDKGHATACLRQRWGADTIVALGDSANDAALLAAADHAVWVRSPVHEPPPGRGPAPRLTRATGPAGWAEAISELFDEGAIPDG